MRLIDADSLKEDLRLYFTDGVLDGVSAKLAFNQIMHDIDNAPTVEERRSGRWKLDETEQFCYCSVCQCVLYPRPLDPSWGFCPVCGSKMED